tara:strand:- start:342 stop:449 length:108 start_codon:yes stop_codon:yes gene_type:complete
MTASSGYGKGILGCLIALVSAPMLSAKSLSKFNGS